MNEKNLTEQFLTVGRIIVQSQFLGARDDSARLKGRILAMLKPQQGMLQKELCYLLGLPEPLAEKGLSRMENDGLLTRVKAEQGQRVKLTAAGLEAANQPVKNDNEEAFACLNKEEKAALGGYLDRIEEAMRQDVGEDFDEFDPHRWMGNRAGWQFWGRKMKHGYWNGRFDN